MIHEGPISSVPKNKYRYLQLQSFYYNKYNLYLHISYIILWKMNFMLNGTTSHIVAMVAPLITNTWPINGRVQISCVYCHFVKL